MSLSFLLVFSLLSSQGFLVKKLLPSSYEIAYSLKKTSSKESQEKLVKFLLDATQNDLAFTPGLVNEVVNKDLNYQEVISDFKENVSQIRNKEASKSKSKSSSSSKKVYESFAKWKTSLNFKKPYSSYHYAQEYLTNHNNDQLQELANYWQKDALQLFLPKLNDYWSSQKNIIVDDIINTPNDFTSIYAQWIDFLANYLAKDDIKWQDYFVKLRNIDKTFYEQKRKERYIPLKISNREYLGWTNSDGFKYVKEQLQIQKDFDKFPQEIKNYQPKWDFYNFLTKEGNDQQYLDWKKTLSDDQAKILLQYNNIKDKDHEEFVKDYIRNNFDYTKWKNFDFAQDKQAFNDFHQKWQKLELEEYNDQKPEWLDNKDQIWNSFNNYISNLDSNDKDNGKWFYEFNWAFIKKEQWEQIVEQFFDGIRTSLEFSNLLKWWNDNKDKNILDSYFDNEYKNDEDPEKTKNIFDWIIQKQNSLDKNKFQQLRVKIIQNFKSDINNPRIKKTNLFYEIARGVFTFKKDFDDFWWKLLVEEFFNSNELSEYSSFDENVFSILRLNEDFQIEFDKDTTKKEDTKIYDWVKSKWKNLLKAKPQNEISQLKTKFINYYNDKFENEILLRNSAFQNLYEDHKKNPKFIDKYKIWIKNEIKTKEKDYKKQIEKLPWFLQISQDSSNMLVKNKFTDDIELVFPLIKDNKKINYDPSAEYQQGLWEYELSRYRTTTNKKEKEKNEIFDTLVAFMKRHSKILKNKLIFSILSSETTTSQTHDINYGTKFSQQVLQNFKVNYSKANLDKEAFKNAWKIDSDQFSLLFSSFKEKVEIDENYDLQPFKKDITSWLKDNREYNSEPLKIEDTFFKEINYEQREKNHFTSWVENTYKKSREEMLDLTLLIEKISKSFSRNLDYINSINKLIKTNQNYDFNKLKATKSILFQEYNNIQQLFILLKNQFKDYLGKIDMTNQEIKEYTTKKYKNSNEFLADFRSLIASKNLQLQKVLHNWYINNKPKQLLQSNYQGYRSKS